MAAELIGRNLGPYRIIEQIGRGGMATVYKAFQPSMDRYVAVKVLPAHFMQDPTFAQRFEREAHTIARLEHPHILPVYDYGAADDGITYIAMRYVEAGTLSDLIQQGPLPLPEAARYFEQIADALAYAHEQGVVHRDMKPSNVMVDERGQTFLTDFGLARMVEGSGQLTGSMILGTPAYMAPELIQGKAADERSDIYALGIVLYEMMTGRPPFEAETPVAVMMKHITEPLPLPHQLNPEISAVVERVILKALAKEPDGRYQNVTTMLAELQQAMVEEPTRVSPLKATVPAAPEPVADSQPPQRPAWLWPVVGVVALLLVVAGILALVLNSRDDSEAAVAGEGAAPVVLPAAASTPSGWTHFSNTRNIQAIALQDDLVWTATEGGLVAWNRHDGSYQKFTTLDGLPYHTIQALLVSQDGALWAGTEILGIIHTDGEAWHIFDHDTGLPSDSVYVLFEAEDDTILAGTHYAEQAISQFDGAEWSTPDWIAPDIPPMPVEFPKPSVFLEDGEGGLLVGLTDEGGLLHFDSSQWQRFATADALHSDSINDLAFDAEGNLWVATAWSGGVGVFDGETFQPIPRLAGVLGTVLYTAPDDTLWIGTQDNGLWRFDGEELTPFTEDEGLPSGMIRDIVQDEEGVLWLGVWGAGLVRFDGRIFETWAIENEPPFNQAHQILESDDGRLWFVRNWGDPVVAIYDPQADTWDTVEISGSNVNIMAFAPDGSRWFGTDEGLWQIDPDGARHHFTSDNGLPDLPITTLAVDGNNRLWAGSENGLVYHNLDDGEATWNDFTGQLLSPRVQTLYTDPDGDLWVGVGQESENPTGIVWIHDGETQATWTTGDTFPETMEIIQDLAMDAEGRLWVGTWGDRIWRLEEKNESAAWHRFDNAEGAPTSETLSIASYTDGTVWIGTWYDGLWRFHPDEGWWQLETGDGLPGLTIFGSHVAMDGSLWLGTEGGIARYVPGNDLSSE